MNIYVIEGLDGICEIDVTVGIFIGTLEEVEELCAEYNNMKHRGDDYVYSFCETNFINKERLKELTK